MIERDKETGLYVDSKEVRRPMRGDSRRFRRYLGHTGSQQIMASQKISAASGFTFVSSLVYVPYNGGSTTTTAWNVSGASLIVMFIGGYVDYPPATLPTDTKLNTYVARTLYNGAPQFCRFYYCINPITASNLQITVPFAGGANYTIICALAFSGAGTSSYHSENGVSPIDNPLRAGPITPSVNNSLVVAGCSSYNTPGTPVLNTGGFAYYSYGKVAGNDAMGGIAYLIQPVAATINPAWTGFSVGGTNAAAIVDFAP